MSNSVYVCVLCVWVLCGVQGLTYEFILGGGGGVKRGRGSPKGSGA